MCEHRYGITEHVHSAKTGRGEEEATSISAWRRFWRVLDAQVCVLGECKRITHLYEAVYFPEEKMLMMPDLHITTSGETIK